MEQNIESQDIGAQNSPATKDTKFGFFGFTVGLFLSIAYIVAVILIFIVSITTETNPSQMDFVEKFKLILYFSFFGFVIGLFSAVLPSALIGSVTGLVIGTIAEDSARKTSKVVFIVISMAICSLIALLIHIVFRIRVNLSFESPGTFGIFESYPLWFGIPTIIYILAGGWFGWKTHSKFTTP